MAIETLAQAHALHQEGRLDEAAAAYRQILQEEPDSFKAHNNLGTVLEDQEKFEEAVASYKRALALESSHSLIHYNLGHALQAKKSMKDAADAYLAALEIDPDHLKCKFNLGMIRHQQGRLDSAIEWYSQVTESAPEFGKAHEYLGKALFDKGAFRDALASHRRRVQIDPEDDAAHFSVGICLGVLGNLEDARDSFQRALALRPMAATYEHLGRILRQMGDRDGAAAIYRQWLVAQPENPAAKHMLTAATGEDVPAKAPGEYVKQIYDEFSADFDETLHRLGYRGPQIIAAAMNTARPTAAQTLKILDAGCGTGLCGALLRSHAERLVGVDLSNGMLAKAGGRGCYDELHSAELTEFLTRFENAYDVIVCADTLIYFGDVERVFAAAASALRSDGLFVFTIENLLDASSEENYRLNDHGRYSHTQGYIEETLTTVGLPIREISSEVIRTESQVPVAGLSVTACKEVRKQ